MLTKTRAVVLRTLKYGDSQIIADMLTQTNGRLSFIQHIPKSARARVKKQLLQPLSILDIVFDYRQNTRLLRISDAAIACPLSSIPFDAYKLSIAMFVAEFTNFATRSEQDNEPLFQYIVNSIMWLDACRSAFSNFHIVYMMHLTRFVGFYPNLESRKENAYFDLRSGCFTDGQPWHTDFLKPEEAARIATLMRMRYETMHLFAFSRNERNRCVDLILKYYRLHVPDFPELKSLDVLQELFT